MYIYDLLKHADFKNFLSKGKLSVFLFFEYVYSCLRFVKLKKVIIL